MKYQFAILMMAAQLTTAFFLYTLPSMAKSSIFRGTASVTSQLNALSFQAKINDLIVFPEVGLAIPQPIGFEKSTSFYGFEQSSTASSVLLTVIPGPFTEVTKGLNKKGLATKGIALLSRQAIKIKNQPGFLLHVAQSAAGQKFLKWIVVFGDEQKTNIVTATFLSKNSAKLSEPLKKIVLAVSPNSQPTSTGVSSLPFRIEAVAGLTLVRKVAGVGKIAAFTKDGNIPTASPADPIFIVAPSLGTVPVGDQQTFATRRLSNYPQTSISAIQSTKEIMIDNLPAWEIVADGQDQKTKMPLKIYQVMLFPKQGGYIVMTGIVGNKQAETYLPKFQAMALTYKNSAK